VFNNVLLPVSVSINWQPIYMPPVKRDSQRRP
jgi:hypothetical protein